MSTLDVPGARLNYMVQGEGPLTLFIPGARGDSAVYRAMALHLASDRKVLIYDRRGFAGSTLTSEQDDSVRLDTDADDVAALITAEGAGGAATVFGSSSGAIVALRFLIRHPDAVSILVAHEPPAVSRLPAEEARANVANFHTMYDTYRSAGLQPAMGQFLMQMMSASDRKTLLENAGRADPAQAARDFDYWFEHELRQYPPTVFDDDKLRAAGERLMFVAGEDTDDLLPNRVAALFAEQLGLPLRRLPGGHVGYTSFPEAFASALRSILVEPAGVH